MSSYSVDALWSSTVFATTLDQQGCLVRPYSAVGQHAPCGGLAEGARPPLLELWRLQNLGIVFSGWHDSFVSVCSKGESPLVVSA